jgi:Txe/YoeB family toxin of Txe-Axe toxin-antitoxin module|tara:strand:- start:7573 stop:7797 length:225 start_codon:yes stop_codon:yes gene_type:complete
MVKILKELAEYISTVEKKSFNLIKKYEKTVLDLNKANSLIGDLQEKLETSESSRRSAKKNIEVLIKKIRNNKLS